MTTTLYHFGPNKTDGDKSMKASLGGKGANLAEMAKLGLPIPPGMTIPTGFCNEYLNGSFVKRKAIIKTLTDDVVAAIEELGETYGLMTFSARSGAPISMPGMMDTILNIGITASNLLDFREAYGDVAALDSYRRLIQMYGTTVHGIKSEVFDHAIKAVAKFKYGMDEAPGAISNFSVAHYERLIEKFHETYLIASGSAFPGTLRGQIAGSIGAVFSSWGSERAIAYRNDNKIPHDMGTAVNIQLMVRGNANDNSATGVLFTRDPSTGVPGLKGEFLVNAQGEDVVAGIRTPIDLTEMPKLGGVWAEVYDELAQFAAQMEKHYGDMQDMEFTVEDGRLWILQTRVGKREAAAAFRIASDMVDEGLITKSGSLARVNGTQYRNLLRPKIDPKFSDAPVFTGIPASSGIVTGKAAFSNAEAEAHAGDCILVRPETTPDDYPGMAASVGVLTVTGGLTCHAAVVARGMDKACVVGTSNLNIGVDIKSGDTVTIDGGTGRVWVNVDVPVIKGALTSYAKRVVDWALENYKGLIGITPRFSQNYKTWDDEADNLMPVKGSYYVETCRMHSSKSTKYIFAKALMRLKDNSETSGIIHLGREKGFEGDLEMLDWLGLGADSVSPESDIHTPQKTSVLLQSRWTAEFKSRWAIELPEEISPITRSLIHKSGWRTVTEVHTLRDALTANGILRVAPEFTARMSSEGVEVSDILTLLSDAGKTVDLMPEVVDSEDAVFAALSG